MYTKIPSSTVTCVVGDCRSWLHCKPIILLSFILHKHFDDFYSKCFMTINFGQLFIFCTGNWIVPILSSDGNGSNVSSFYISRVPALKII